MAADNRARLSWRRFWRAQDRDDRSRERDRHQRKRGSDGEHLHACDRNGAGSRSGEYGKKLSSLEHAEPDYGTPCKSRLMQRWPTIVRKLQGIDEIPAEREPCQSRGCKCFYHLIAQE